MLHESKPVFPGEIFHFRNPQTPVSNVSLGSQRPFGTRHLSLLAWYPAGRHLDSYGQGLEGTLGSVVVVVSPDAVDVHCYPCALRKALQTVGDHFRAQLP